MYTCWKGVREIEMPKMILHLSSVNVGQENYSDCIGFRIEWNSNRMCGSADENMRNKKGEIYSLFPFLFYFMRDSGRRRCWNAMIFEILGLNKFICAAPNVEELTFGSDFVGNGLHSH